MNRFNLGLVFISIFDSSLFLRILVELFSQNRLVVMEDRYLDDFLTPSPLPANSMENVASINLPCGKRYKFAYLPVNGSDNCPAPNLFECTVTDPRNPNVKYVHHNLFDYNI